MPTMEEIERQMNMPEPIIIEWPQPDYCLTVSFAGIERLMTGCAAVKFNWDRRVKLIYEDGSTETTAPGQYEP